MACVNRSLVVLGWFDQFGRSRDAVDPRVGLAWSGAHCDGCKAEVVTVHRLCGGGRFERLRSIARGLAVESGSLVRPSSRTGCFGAPLTTMTTSCAGTTCGWVHSRYFLPPVTTVTSGAVTQSNGSCVEGQFWPKVCLHCVRISVRIVRSDTSGLGDGLPSLNSPTVQTHTVGKRIGGKGRLEGEGRGVVRWLSGSP